MTDPTTLTIDVDADEFATACEDVATAAEEFREACERLEETSITMTSPIGDPTEIPATDLVGIEASVNIEMADALSTGDDDE